MYKERQSKRGSIYGHNPLYILRIKNSSLLVSRTRNYTVKVICPYKDIKDDCSSFIILKQCSVV